MSDLNTQVETTKNKLQLLAELKRNNEYLRSLKEKSTSSFSSEKSSYEEEEKEEIDEETDEFSLEVDFYYSNIYEMKIELNQENALDLISEFLPSKSNNDYQKIINRILANIELEIYEYQIEIERVKNDCSEEEIRDYNNEIELLKYKKYLVSESVKIQEQQIDEKIENKIVLVMKNDESSYVLDDLSKIPSEYYEEFLSLIDSIKNNTFINVRYFKSINSKNKGISEIKGFKRRILFDRVGPHTYALFAAFVKKSDNDKDYREFVNNRISIYRCKKNSIIEDIKKEDYMSKNELRVEELYSLLSKNKVNSEGGSYGL